MHLLEEERPIRWELIRGFPAAAGQVRDPDPAAEDRRAVWDPVVAWVHLVTLVEADTSGL